MPGVASRLARLCLVALLLAGWQAALLHPLQHQDESGRYVHPGGGAGSSLPGKLLACDALAALTACAPEALVAFVASVVQQPLLVSPAAQRRAAEPPPFLSQGPPAFL